jgi:hypothetical protein
MSLHPNPPRMITVAAAVALAVIGVVFALPMDAGVALLEPILEPFLTPIGLPVDRELGYLALFLSSGLLVAGSLLPGR